MSRQKRRARIQLLRMNQQNKSPEYETGFKCGTFKTDKENGITPEIRIRMNADRVAAEKQL